MKYLLIVFLVLLTLSLPAKAAEAEEQFPGLDLEGLEREGEGYLSGLDLDAPWEENLTALMDTGAEELGGILRPALRSCVLLLGAAVFSAVGEELSKRDMASLALRLAGTVAVSVVAVTDIRSMLGMGLDAISSMSSFSGVLLPTVAVLTAATGAITGAGARQMAAVLFSTLLMKAIDGLLVPLLYGYTALSIGHAATGNDGLKRAAALFKWLAATGLTVLLLVYVGYLSFSGVVSGSSDAAAVKAAKFAISSAVPVVGGILADASGSILASAGILRSTVGVFGMIVILGICLLPFLGIGIHYLIYKFAAAASATLGGGPVPELIDALSKAFGLVMGMTGACALLLLISLVSSVMVVTV